MANLDTSISRFAEKHQVDFVEICICNDRERFLGYNAADKTYFGEGGCNKNFTCAILQIHKHKIDLLARKQRLLEPNAHHRKKERRILKTPFDQTLDQFL
ncbi:MAG: hypothetical protein ACTSXO_08890 [Candidatus Heimdallarchaeota archaeon]|nr:hypothetical protein [Candidatus Heimdallarchaeota archaeon]RLI72558.1 MAG: hypothetical protein DRP02_01295 [Candidatus Gerdarchaeota archaeon]